MTGNRQESRSAVYDFSIFDPMAQQRRLSGIDDAGSMLTAI